MANTRKQNFREKAATECVTIVQKGSGPRYKCLGPTATEEATSKPIAPDKHNSKPGEQKETKHCRHGRIRRGPKKHSGACQLQSQSAGQ